VTYDFNERLIFSKGRRQDSDIETLRAMFPASCSVIKTSEEQDRAGTDYIITLRRGAQLRVDAKSRDAGCRQYWQRGPEVALETWSVRPDGCYGTPQDRARVGWTLDEAKEIDLILFTFDPRDHVFAYVRPLPLLREAFRRNFGDWRKEYKTATQDSDHWESECVFVPLLVLDQAIEAVSRKQLLIPQSG
jgi:hypothetical protein